MRLTRVEGADLRNNRPFLAADDECFYLREFTARRGFGHSETNQLIFNLKKKPSRRALPDYPYKVRAIQQCATELRAALGLPQSAPDLEGWTVVPMPPSKAVGHPEYDNRMELVARGLAEGLPSLDTRPLLRLRRSMAAAHESEERPTVGELVEAMEVAQPVQPPVRRQGIILLDDVLTQGAHFRAAKTVLRAALDQVRVVGVFIAKAVHAEDPLVDVLKAFFAGDEGSQP